MDGILHGLYPPSIYHFISRERPSTVVAQVEAHGWRCFYLDGRTITGKESFLRAGASAMHFPDYFGWNWDAFEDCLTDLSWLPSPGYVILYDHVVHFAARTPEQWAVALDILRAAVTYWKAHATPMVVLLRRMGHHGHGIPRL